MTYIVDQNDITRITGSTALASYGFIAGVSIMVSLSASAEIRDCKLITAYSILMYDLCSVSACIPVIAGTMA